MLFCLVSNAALANPTNQIKVDFFSCRRYLVQHKVAARQRLRHGTSSITVFSNSKSEGIKASNAVESAAVHSSCNSRTISNQAHKPKSAKARMVSRAATTPGPSSRKDSPSNP